MCVRFAALAFGLASGLVACGGEESRCAETRTALTAPSTPEDGPLPDGRYGLGAAFSRELLDGLFAEAAHEANRHLTGRALAQLPENAREIASGRLRIRIEELRYVGPGECPGCLDLALRAAGTWNGSAGTVRLTLRARPSLTIRLVTTASGIEVHGALEAMPGSIELSAEPRADRPAPRQPVGPLRQRRRERRAALRERVLAERGEGGRGRLLEGIEARLETPALVGLRHALRRRLAAGPLTTLDQRPAESEGALPEVRRAELHPLEDGWFLGADLAGYPTDLVAPTAPRGDITLFVPGDTLLRSILAARAEGVVPARVSREGRPAQGEDGLVVLPRSIELGEGDGRVTIRFGRDQGVCGYLDVSTRVRAVVEDGEIRLAWDDVTAEEAGQAGRLARTALDLYQGFWDEQMGGVAERPSTVSVHHGERPVNLEVSAIRMTSERVEVDLWAAPPEG